MAMKGSWGMASVLCVDDEPAVLRTIQLVLQSADHTVQVATNVVDGIALLKNQQFDLMLLDCIINCKRLVEEARRVNPRMRIVLCTGRDLERENGLPWVDAIIPKPFPAPELLRKISDLLADSCAA
jgi:DNA-binding response OmpR family regulator